MKDLITHLKQQLPENLRFLQRMVSMESPSFDKPLVDKFVRFVGSRFQEMGGEIEYVATERFGDQMLARFSGKSSDRILLLGHTDTVWPAGEIEKRPFEIGDGRIFGPGRKSAATRRGRLRSPKPLDAALCLCWSLRYPEVS